MRRLAAWVVGASLAVVPALAAAPPEDPVDTFDDSIDVQLLEVEVVVTNRDGDVVTGLPADAFEVRLHGEVRPIVHFSEVVETRTAATEGETSPPGGPSGEPGPPPTPTHYLVFIDDLMTLERNRDFVLHRLREQLGGLRPGDTMAIVRFGERKLHVLADWTHDPERLDEALVEALARPALGVKYIALRRMEDYIANWEGNDTRRSILAASASMRIVEPPAGRRALLLVAGSWDPAEVSRSDEFSDWCVSGRCDRAWVYNVLTDTANQLSYSIYAVDVEGRDPENWEREKRLQDVLGELARLTGGRRLLNAERRRMLSIAADDKRAYYTLAVRPSGDRDDLRRNVEVRLLRPGLEARSQTAFVPVSRERQRELELFSSLYLLADSSDELHLQITPPERLPKGRMAVTVAAAIPTEALTWTGDEALFALETAAVDARGHSSPMESREVRLTRSPDLASGDSFVYTLDLDLRRRPHTLALLLRDLNGDTVLRAVTDVPRG